MKKAFTLAEVTISIAIIGFL
ncbi:MAG: prepilin-type N-terminal cleavage/methylation domain-containing protein, partial [bacterium]|nr:prepilin-type N-terminal cleavage/methylation domain-containing protein [bacterium]